MKNTKNSIVTATVDKRYSKILQVVTKILEADDAAKRRLDPLKDPSRGLTPAERLARSYSLWIAASGATGATPEVKEAFQAFQAWNEGGKPRLPDGSVLTVTSRRFVRPDETGVPTAERSIYRAERQLTLTERLPLIVRQKEALDRLHALATAAARANKPKRGRVRKVKSVPAEPAAQAAA